MTQNWFTLRDWPLPAKLVLSTFLISVGIGYFSALVQLHMQHGSRDGNPLPTPADVVEHFAGVKPYDGQPPQSKLEAILMGPNDGGFTKNNMSPAFFAKSSGYAKEIQERGQTVVDAERDAEKRLLMAWFQLDTATKKTTYANQEAPVPPDFLTGPMTEGIIDAEKKTFNPVLMIEERCLKCHGEGGSNKPEMDTFEKLEPLITPPPLEILPGNYVRSSKQTSLEGLTQSTHAHLLSFSVLFTLTGLIFAGTSYPGWLRGFLGPLVLVAQLADIACWWLARLDGVGPMFAQAILLTGGIVGLGLALQIVLSLFNLYGWKGKLVLLLLGGIAAAGFGVLVQQVIRPALQAEAAAVAKSGETSNVNSEKTPGTKPGT